MERDRKEENLICHYITVSIEGMPGKGNISAAEAENKSISSTIRQFYHWALSVKIALTPILRIIQQYPDNFPVSLLCLFSPHSFLIVLPENTFNAIWKGLKPFQWFCLQVKWTETCKQSCCFGKAYPAALNIYFEKVGFYFLVMNSSVV